MNRSPQILQLYRFSPVWLRMCALNVEFWLNARPQTLQLYGRSPVCVLKRVRIYTKRQFCTVLLPCDSPHVNRQFVIFHESFSARLANETFNQIRIMYLSVDSEIVLCVEFWEQMKITQHPRWYLNQKRKLTAMTNIALVRTLAGVNVDVFG